MKPVKHQWRVTAGHPAFAHLPSFCIRFPRRRWRALLRGRVSSNAIRTLARCKQRKPCGWTDLTVMDFVAPQHLGVLPSGTFTFRPQEG